MAKITLLHWNIQDFAENKLTNKNGPSLINYIAKVVADSGANMISLLELGPSDATEIIASLIPAIDKANEVLPPTEWRAVQIDSRHEEAYVVLYQLGNKFEPLTAGAEDEDKNNPIPIHNLTKQRIVDGKPDGSLPFNRPGGVRDPSAKTGGRTPFYVTFRTTEDPKRNFSVVACHIMYGKYKGEGVRSVGLIAQSRVILRKGVKVEMFASMTAGDFNVDFNPEELGDPYKNLLDFSNQATRGKTSLKKKAPAGNPPSSAYLNKAYDNIFQYRKNNLPGPDNGTVFDLINDSAIDGSGLLTAQATPFLREYMHGKEPRKITKIPPKTIKDSWRLVLGAISDHLPVYVSMIIV